MSEAYKVAKQNCDKVKNCTEERWRKRLIATELHTGDKVLVRNKREQGGPGKIRAQWEQQVYVVLDKKPSGVTHTVQKLLDNKGEKRVLHRNMRLPCELMEDLGNNQGEPLQKQSPKTKMKTRQNTRRVSTNMDATSEGSESDEEDEELLQMYPSVGPNPADKQASESPHGEAEEIAPFEDVIAELFGGSEDGETFTGFEEEDDPTGGDNNDNLPDAVNGQDVAVEPGPLETGGQQGARRSTRTKHRRTPYTYFKLGGDPIPV